MRPLGRTLVIPKYLQVTPTPETPVSDLTTLLNAMKTVAVQDYASAVGPVLSQAASQLTATPAAAPSIGVALLANLSTAGVKVAADEVSALVSWINTEVAKLGSSVKTT